MNQPTSLIVCPTSHMGRGWLYAFEEYYKNAFFQNSGQGNVQSILDGTVRFRPDEPDDSRLGDAGQTPVQDVRVTLSGDGNEFHATTTSLGKYSFTKVPPGEYSIDAQLPGYRLDWAPDRLSLAPIGCVAAELLMKVDRRVQGMTRDDSGAPVPDALVEMVSTNQNLKRWEQPVLLGVSDENGHYASTAYHQARIIWA